MSVSIASIWMISIQNVSFELRLLKYKPVTSEDFKYLDDIDMKCQFRIAIIEIKPVTSEDFKYLDDFDTKCQFRIAFFELIEE